MHTFSTSLTLSPLLLPTKQENVIAWGGMLVNILHGYGSHLWVRCLQCSFFCTWLRMTAQCVVLQRSAQAVCLAADAVWWLQCVCLASVLMNKGDVPTWEFCSCEVGEKKSATLLVPFQAVCWDMSFVSVRPIDASGLTPLTLCKALVLAFPPRGKKNVCNVHIRGDSW